MAKEVKIPQIAEDVESATVTEVMVKEGDSIEKDQAIIAVESDKASVEIPSPEAGKVKTVSVSEGDEVEVGDVILILEEGDSKSKDPDDKDSQEEEADEKDLEKNEDQKDEDQEEPKEEDKTDSENSEDEKDKTASKEQEDEKSKKEKPSEEKDSEKQEKKEDKDSEENKEEGSGNADVPAAPGVRRLARELGVNISKVEGSGEGGRISKEDVKTHSKNDKKPQPAKEISLPDFGKWGKTERIALSGIRKVTAKNTTAAWSNIPHVFQFDEADITGIEEYMEKLQKKADGNLSITAVLAKIAAIALRQFPKFNASLDMETEEMILKKYVNIGIAVDTEKGLLVPVIRDADRKTIIEISTEITQLAKKAREGKLTSEEMKGGNFTISNLGGIGGTNFTPIVYHPQVAILGVSRAKKQPIYIDGNFEPRDILPLSLSYDHRIIDGAEGVRFLHWISRALEDPYEALLGA